MDVEWDPRKAHTNHEKHGVRFSDAVTALEDERALTLADCNPEGEDRWVTMGLDASGRLLVVVFTWRGERVRVISARKASSGEREQYLEAL